jgi:FdhD protein
MVVRRRITRVTLGEQPQRREDRLATEEPLEIRIGDSRLGITMRTPGHDDELATGLLVSEGVIVSSEELVAIRHCAGPGVPADGTFNVLDVTLRDPQAREAASTRGLLMSSACGLCGSESIDAVGRMSRFRLDVDDARIDARLLATLPTTLRAGQHTFDTTGGIHAAGLVDLGSGEMLVIREDVGRHNAVDKVIGWAAMRGMLPLRGHALVVSARAGFELAQKATMAGVPVLAAVSAATSLAAELAQKVGLTLVGFLREESFVIYAGADRVHVTADASAREEVHA